MPHDQLPSDWRAALGPRLDARDLRETLDRVAAERAAAAAVPGAEIYPPEGLVFQALHLTPFSEVRAVIVGQDPYHEPGQAHGLAFSTLAAKWPPSLKNIVAALCADTGCERPSTGDLTAWARHGVLLLNTVLTVGRGDANGHAAFGWQRLTGAILAAVADKPGPIVFMLWGGPAQARGASIDRGRHIVLECSHPSPLSVYRSSGDIPAFRDAHPFDRANRELAARGAPPIDWRLG